MRRLAVMGAGNGGFAAAVDLTLRGFEVALWGRSAGTIEPLTKRGGIEYEGVLGDGFLPLPNVTSDPRAAITGADAVIVLAPAQAHESIVTLVAPHLTGEQILLAAPGNTLTLLPNTLRRCGHPKPVACVTNTLPYICRKVAPGRVRISRVSARLRFAAFPGKRTNELAERLRPVFPAIFPVPTLLDTLFPYTNAIHHPPAFLCNIGRIESGVEYMHYYEGITPSVGVLIDRLDDERIAIASAYGCTVDKLSEHFFQMGYTDEHGRAGGTAYDVFHNSAPNRWIRAPSTVDHRFFNEDIPFGLVPFTELARLAGVAAPVSEALVTVACAITGKRYRDAGLNLARLGLEGFDVAGVRHLLQNGFEETTT